MKRNVSIFLIALCLGNSCTSNRTDTDVKNENISSDTTIYTDTETENKSTGVTDTNVLDEKINFIKSFYTEYLTENCTDDGSLPDRKKIEKIKEKYCSKELLTKINTLDYDPFLNAQDCDLEWLNLLNIKMDTNETSWFIVSYSYIDYLNTTQEVEIRIKVIPMNKIYSIAEIGGI